MNEQTIKNYREYQKLITPERATSTYIAKNNNLLLRYGSMRSAFPEFKAVFIFRDPIDHAASLRSQHLRFIDLHEQDPFSLEYMNWLGHHEFGKNHKPFKLSEPSTPRAPQTIEYWLQSWIDYHNELLNRANDQYVTLVDYDEFLSSPQSVLSNLEGRLGLKLESERIEQFTPRKKDRPTAEESLSNEAYAIRQKLKSSVN